MQKGENLTAIKRTHTHTHTHVISMCTIFPWSNATTTIYVIIHHVDCYWMWLIYISPANISLCCCL